MSLHEGAKINIKETKDEQDIKIPAVITGFNSDYTIVYAIQENGIRRELKQGSFELVSD